MGKTPVPSAVVRSRYSPFPHLIGRKIRVGLPLRARSPSSWTPSTPPTRPPRPAPSAPPTPPPPSPRPRSLPGPAAPPGESPPPLSHPIATLPQAPADLQSGRGELRVGRELAHGLLCRVRLLRPRRRHRHHRHRRPRLTPARPASLQRPPQLCLRQRPSPLHALLTRARRSLLPIASPPPSGSGSAGLEGSPSRRRRDACTATCRQSRVRLPLDARRTFTFHVLSLASCATLSAGGACSASPLAPLPGRMPASCSLLVLIRKPAQRSLTLSSSAHLPFHAYL